MSGLVNPYVFGGYDPYWANVILMMGGIDVGSDQTIDESLYGRTWTDYSFGILSSGLQSKFGGRSISAHGGSIKFEEVPSWWFGSDPYTIEFWVHRNSSGLRCLLAQRPVSASMDGAQFSFHRLSDGTIEYFYSIGGVVTGLVSTTAVPNDTWTHIAVDRDGAGKTRLYINGVMEASSTVTGTLDRSLGYPTLASTGDGNNHVGNAYFDELRVTRGVARYGSDSGFALQTEAFPRSDGKSVRFTEDLTTGYLESGFVFARASDGTYTDPSGNIATAVTDEPRFEFSGGVCKGIIIEPARTNLYQRSAEFDNAYWTKSSCTATADQDTAPDGNTAADKITCTAASNVYFERTGAVGDTDRYTSSIYAKGSGGSVGDLITIGNYNNNSRQEERNLVLTSSYSRKRLKFKPTGTTNNNVYVHLISQGATLANTEFIYAWGAQLEKIATGERSEPSTYIATTTGTVTRSADVLNFTVPDGVSYLLFEFDDGSAQPVAVSPGSYDIPANLDRAVIAQISGYG